MCVQCTQTGGEGKGTGNTDHVPSCSGSVCTTFSFYYLPYNKQHTRHESGEGHTWGSGMGLNSSSPRRPWVAYCSCVSWSSISLKTCACIFYLLSYSLGRDFLPASYILQFYTTMACKNCLPYIIVKGGHSAQNKATALWANLARSACGLPFPAPQRDSLACLFHNISLCEKEKQKLFLFLCGAGGWTWPAHIYFVFTFCTFCMHFLDRTVLFRF